MTERDTALEEQDLNEEIINQLRRFLAKLSYAASGVDKSLDKELVTLRNLVKQDASHLQIQEQIDQITNVLRKIDAEAEAQGDSKELDLLKLKKEFSRHDFPGAFIEKLQTLLSDKSHSSLAQFSQILAAAATEWQQNNEQKKGSWLDRFRKKPPPEVRTEAPVLPGEIRQTIEELLKNLDLPDRFETQLKQINQLLQKDISLTALPDLLERTSRIIIEASSEDHIEFEAFLLDLNNRLGKIQEFIENSSSINTTSREAHEKFNEHLNQEFAGLRENVKQADSLDGLRSVVDARLDLVMNALDDYHRVQQSCLERSDSEMNYLRKQLIATENETQRLKQLLIEQRTKAQSDPLTSLPNRHLYLERLDQEYNRWRRYRGSLSLVLADIDHFKKVNDTYGHLAGDSVIKAVAGLLRDGLRESDFIARYGGEEFVVLMPETNMMDATKAVNKLRQQIQQSEIPIRGTMITVTVSFGVAEFVEEDTTLDVFGRADKALYRAKDKGRNQVCCEKKSIDAA